MISPIVTESTPAPEPVTRDPFIASIGSYADQDGSVAVGAAVAAGGAIRSIGS
jgi:hypothetical protein